MQTPTTSEYLSDDVWYVGHLNAEILVGEDEDSGQFETSIQEARRLMIAAAEGAAPNN
ncbi:MAG: hypothetical protein ACR2FI_08305 [Burkholderiales bacterium]|nr:hypothetical protein [Burkholderiales bacterium]MDQ3195312.1 hypothetical protein [Pseudomonadota bacterium]